MRAMKIRLAIVVVCVAVERQLQREQPLLIRVVLLLGKMSRGQQRWCGQQRWICGQ